MNGNKLVTNESLFFRGPLSRFKELMFTFRVQINFIRAFRKLHFLGPCVTIFGSARFTPESEHYKNAFGIQTYGNPIKILLEIDNTQKEYIKSLPFHSTQKIVDEKDKCFTIELFMHPTFDFIMEILRFGKWCEVIEPKNFRDEVKQIINEMNLKYS